MNPLPPYPGPTETPWPYDPSVITGAQLGIGDGSLGMWLLVIAGLSLIVFALVVFITSYKRPLCPDCMGCGEVMTGTQQDRHGMHNERYEMCPKCKGRGGTWLYGTGFMLKAMWRDVLRMLWFTKNEPF